MPICEKGVIRTALSGVENLSPELPLYEVIDDKEHSNSNKVFIDIDSHNKKCVIGFEKSATTEQINKMVDWFSIGKEHYEASRIATRGSGYKLWSFQMRGNYSHISKIDNNKYAVSHIDTSKIYNAEIDPEVSNTEFSSILSLSTTSAKEQDELFPSHQAIFENIDNYYPFMANTVIETKNISNSKILNYFNNTDNTEETQKNQDDILKRLRIKYYNEFFEKKFELFIKFPNNKEFTKVNIENSVDIIGVTNNCYDKHITNIFISKDVKIYYGYVFEIEKNFYYLKKNGNSVLRDKLTSEESKSYINKKPDYIFVQYNIKNTESMTPEEKIKLYDSIVGKSLEYYAGVYINIGGVFINSEKVTWGVKERNLQGSKHYRAVLYVNTSNAKQDIGLSGLKAQFNLLTKNNLHEIIKSLTDIYKKYCSLGQSKNPDDYVVVKSTAQKCTGEKKLDGFFYFCRVGKNFYKLGFCTTQTRPFDYIKSKLIEETQACFNDEELYTNPYLVYFSLYKISNIRGLEEKIKSMVNELSTKGCETFEALGGDIREYFHCDNFSELLPIFIEEIEKY